MVQFDPNECVLTGDPSARWWKRGPSGWRRKSWAAGFFKLHYYQILTWFSNGRTGS